MIIDKEDYFTLEQKCIALELECEKLKQQNMCDACAGTGTPAGGVKCMCGGTGRMSDAAVFLREQLVEASLLRSQWV